MLTTPTQICNLFLFLFLLIFVCSGASKCSYKFKPVAGISVVVFRVTFICRIPKQSKINKKTFKAAQRQLLKGKSFIPVALRIKSSLPVAPYQRKSSGFIVKRRIKALSLCHCHF